MNRPVNPLEYLPPLQHVDGSKVRVLVAEDDPSIADLVTLTLKMAGWDTALANDGLAAVRLAESFKPDVLLLDRMLPGLEGVTVLERIRRFLPDIPAIFLTAKDSIDDRLDGLLAGADDYIVKPFTMEEVLLRLHRLVVRTGVTATSSEVLQVGDLSLNVDTREVSRGGDIIELTATQFDLLRFLMENPNCVLSKGQILENVWHYDFAGQANVVELYISYLRKKIDEGRAPMIHTVRGAGYVLKPASVD